MAMARFLFRHKYSFTIFLFLGIPLLTYAQSSGLVPCGNTLFNINNAVNTSLSATQCNLCYLTQLIQNVVNFLIMVAIPISIAMFAWAGIKFFTATGNPKRIAEARSIFVSVFWGFLIAISGWLVVQVVLQTISNANFYQANSWVTVSDSCRKFDGQRPRNLSITNLLGSNSLEVPRQPTTAPVDPTSPGPAIGSVSGGSIQNQANVDTLKEAGIPVVSSAGCSDPSNKNCTALDKVNSSVIQSVIQLKQESGQALQVSGGDEVGHQNVNQQNGNSVDVSFQDITLKNNAAAINSVINTARAQGRCAVWEPGAGKICPVGVTSRCLQGPGTDGHFSLYMSPNDSPSCGN